jgi:hypothetical protein
MYAGDRGEESSARVSCPPTGARRPAAQPRSCTACSCSRRSSSRAWSSRDRSPRAPSAGAALGANIVGSVLGGWTEYATMALGIQAMAWNRSRLLRVLRESCLAAEQRRSSAEPGLERARRSASKAERSTGMCTAAVGCSEGEPATSGVAAGTKPWPRDRCRPPSTRPVPRKRAIERGGARHHGQRPAPMTKSSTDPS